MKRFTIIALFSFMAVLTVSTALYADEVETAAVWHPAYVDADHDGVCDAPKDGNFFNANLYGAYNNENIIDSDGDGVCDYDGVRYNTRERANGFNHIDANGDGICDYCAYRLSKKSAGSANADSTGTAAKAARGNGRR